MKPRKIEFTRRLPACIFIVVGGSTAQKRQGTPDWKPPVRWVFDLADQWKSAKGSMDGFYAKTNLLGSTCREGLKSLGKDEIVPQEKAELPAIFRYLGKS